MSRSIIQENCYLPAYLYNQTNDVIQSLSAIYGAGINRSMLITTGLAIILEELEGKNRQEIIKKMISLSHDRNMSQKLRLEHDKNQYQAYLTRRKRALFKSSTNASTADL